jgi:hypothetical protein
MTRRDDGAVSCSSSVVSNGVFSISFARETQDENLQKLDTFIEEDHACPLESFRILDPPSNCPIVEDAIVKVFQHYKKTKKKWQELYLLVDDHDDRSQRDNDNAKKSPGSISTILFFATELFQEVMLYGDETTPMSTATAKVVRKAIMGQWTKLSIALFACPSLPRRPAFWGKASSRQIVVSNHWRCLIDQSTVDDRSVTPLAQGLALPRTGAWSHSRWPAPPL